MTHLDILARLEAALAAASARPWRIADRGTHGAKIWDSPDGGATDCVAGVHCGGRCGTGQPNADLIVLAVNALPALLAVARAAEAWRDARE